MSKQFSSSDWTNEEEASAVSASLCAPQMRFKGIFSLCLKLFFVLLVAAFSFPLQTWGWIPLAFQLTAVPKT